ncbi:MAG: hypothetical protein HZA35_00555 [Parcubacteria group bacterium]|nr:hypothetical protein [Parcubacteria group bacterium]
MTVGLFFLGLLTFIVVAAYIGGYYGQPVHSPLPGMITMLLWTLWFSDSITIGGGIAVTGVAIAGTILLFFVKRN